MKNREFLGKHALALVWHDCEILFLPYQQLTFPRLRGGGEREQGRAEERYVCIQEELIFLVLKHTHKVKE